jgi:hypothetical protein
MTFRFILQPAMAIIAALRDGVHDARIGRRPYFWALTYGVRDPAGRSGRLWEGIISTARILILGVVMDVVYQWLAFRTFYPGQAAVITILLAFVPYLLLRGPFARSRVLGSPGPHPVEPPDLQRTMASPDLKFNVNTELAARARACRFSARA